MNGGFVSFNSSSGIDEAFLYFWFFRFLFHSEISVMFDDFLKQSTHIPSSTLNIQSLYFSQYFSAFSLSSSPP